MKRILALLVFSSLALAFDPLPPIPQTEGLDSAEQIILNLTNRERATAGLPPLKWDARLQVAARLHALDLAERNYFSHTSDKPGFETPTKRVHKVGVLDFGAGENIAFNEVALDSTGEKFMTQWMNSPPHRASILDKSYTHIGIGVYQRKDGRIYGVQNFVARPLELIPDTTRGVVDVRQLRLEGKVNSGLELALFSGKQYLGIVPVDASGNFARVLDFVPAQNLQLGWRRIGDKGAYLVQASLTQPSSFAAGAVAVKLQRNAPHSLSAALESKREDSFTLELRFPNAKKTVLLLEGTERRIAQNSVVRTRCPVGNTRKALQIGYGDTNYTITHRFAFDCRTGMLEAGATQ
ncbi:MAG: CAP domain-containing protein [Deinococcales bacterium]